MKHATLFPPHATKYDSFEEPISLVGRGSNKGSCFRGEPETRDPQVVYLPCEDGQSVSIGRGSKADVSLGREHKQVSRVHLVVTRLGPGRFLVHVQGTNGAVIDRVTYPCNSRVTDVRDGTVCILGDARFLFCDPTFEDVVISGNRDRESGERKLPDFSIAEHCEGNQRDVKGWNGQSPDAVLASDPFTCASTTTSILPPKKRKPAGSYCGPSSDDNFSRSDTMSVSRHLCSTKDVRRAFAGSSSSPVRCFARSATATASTPNTERLSSVADVGQAKASLVLSPSREPNASRRPTGFARSGDQNERDGRNTFAQAEVLSTTNGGCAVRKARDPGAEGSRLRKEIEEVKGAAQAVKFFTSKPACNRLSRTTTAPVFRSSALSAEDEGSKENSERLVSAASTDCSRQPSLLSYARERKSQQDPSNSAKRRCARLSAGMSSPLSSVPDLLITSGEDDSGDDGKSLRSWEGNALQSASLNQHAEMRKCSSVDEKRDDKKRSAVTALQTPSSPPHPPGGPHSYESLIADALVFSGKRCMTISDVLEEMARAVPSARRPEEALFWRHYVSRALEQHPFFVRVPRSGKDATGKEREDLWHYDISADPDTARRTTYADIRKAAPRACTMVDTQYYWKPVPKLPGWKGKGCSRGPERSGKKKKTVTTKGADTNIDENYAEALAQ